MHPLHNYGPIASITVSQLEENCRSMYMHVPKQVLMFEPFYAT